MSETRPEQAAPSLGEDWPAIAACAAHHGIVAPAEALASWRALNEDRRIAWRASADAVRMLLDARQPPPRDKFDAWLDSAKPSPELAAAMAETRLIRQRMTALADALDASAERTHPSKKSEIEREAARRIRAALEG